VSDAPASHRGRTVHGTDCRRHDPQLADVELPAPVNTDGGLIANGEPIGASGLRLVHELVHLPQGQAGERQVPGNPRVGYAQVYGAPGTAAASILSN
jgi:acetyl-CoA C-acetyltransferase